jgi:hypothetical protein
MLAGFVGRRAAPAPSSDIPLRGTPPRPCRTSTLESAAAPSPHRRRCALWLEQRAGSASSRLRSRALRTAQAEGTHATHLVTMLLSGDGRARAFERKARSERVGRLSGSSEEAAGNARQPTKPASIAAEREAQRGPRGRPTRERPQRDPLRRPTRERSQREISRKERALTRRVGYTV